MTDDQAIALEAAKLLEAPGAWTQGAFARDNLCNNAFPQAPEAACWCLQGAIRKVRAAREFDFSSLVNFLGKPMWEFNDAYGQTQANVVATLKAFAKLEKLP